jgi:hypothetical protein
MLLPGVQFSKAEGSWWKATVATCHFLYGAKEKWRIFSSGGSVLHSRLLRYSCSCPGRTDVGINDNRNVRGGFGELTAGFVPPRFSFFAGWSGTKSVWITLLTAGEWPVEEVTEERAAPVVERELEDGEES